MGKERRVVTPAEAAAPGGVKVPMLTTKEALMGFLNEEVGFAATSGVMCGEMGTRIDGETNMEIFKRAGLTGGEELKPSLVAFRLVLIELATKLRVDGCVALVDGEEAKGGEDAETDTE